MICPQCGYEMGNKNKCLRCGYEIKTLTVVDRDERSERTEKKEEKIETKIIDPCNVFLTHPYGYDDDFGTGYGPSDDPFVSIIDELFGDPIGGLFGGLFGFDFGPRRRVVVEPPPEPPKKKKQGPIIVVDDVEIIPAESENNEPAPSETDKKDGKIKNIFKRKGKKF